MIKQLWGKYRELFWELFRFGLVGGISFLFDYGTLMLVRFLFFKDEAWEMALAGIKLNMNLLIATAAGFMVGVTVNYILSVIFVFRAAKGKGRDTKAVILFLMIAMVGLFLTEVLMHLGEVVFGDGDWAVTATKIAATLIVMFWNYISRKLLIFKTD